MKAEHWMVYVAEPGCAGALHYFYDNAQAAYAHHAHIKKLQESDLCIFRNATVHVERVSGIVRSEFPQPYVVSAAADMLADAESME